jgi:hypothetical protein
MKGLTGGNPFTILKKILKLFQNKGENKTRANVCQKTLVVGGEKNKRLNFFMQEVLGKFAQRWR